MLLTPSGNLRQSQARMVLQGENMNESSRILLVEDDPLLAKEICKGLERAGLGVDHVTNITDAFEAIMLKSYRAVLLDRRLPDGDGLSIVAAAKSRPTPPAVIFLTARDEVSDRVEGLDAGADDYIVKPFALSELLARLRAASRKPVGARAPQLVHVGALTFDLSTRDTTVHEKPLNLSRRESALLELLARRAGRVVQRDFIESELYGFDADVSPNALETHVSRLRRRLQEADAGVDIKMIRGVGYLLQQC